MIRGGVCVNVAQRSSQWLGLGPSFQERRKRIWRLWTRCCAATLHPSSTLTKVDACTRTAPKLKGVSVAVNYQQVEDEQMGRTKKKKAGADGKKRRSSAGKPSNQKGRKQGALKKKSKS